MTSKFGVSMEDETKEAIEEYRIRRDPETGDRIIKDRSEAVRDLLGIGLAVAEVIDEGGLALEFGRPRRAWARQAALNELEREFED